MKNGFQSGFFAGKFGISQSDLDRLLSSALANGGDYADLYLEYRTRDMMALEEGVLKNASRNISQGIGVRVVAGEKTGYAAADTLDLHHMASAAAEAGKIAVAGAPRASIHSAVSQTLHDLYRVPDPLVDASFKTKLMLLQEADRAARAYGQNIVEVRVVLANEVKHVLIHNSTGA
ncbi:metalloprotease TldD, partial [bacterium]